MILCSWCSKNKLYMVKHYMPGYTCILGATRNRRVSGHVLVEKFGDVIAGIPIINPRHLKVLVKKELVMFITDKICENARCLVSKKIEKQLIEDFKVLNGYALELRATNIGSNVVVVVGRPSSDASPIFQKMYICLTTVREGFLACCRRLIG